MLTDLERRSRMVERWKSDVRRCLSLVEASSSWEC